jgi:hypothetical protein
MPCDITHPMDVDSRPRRRDGVLAQTAGDSVLLLTGDTGEYYTLNDVGGRIWELCDGERSVAEIAAVIGDEFEAPPEVIQADTLDVLEELAGEGLVIDGGVAA